MMDRERIESVFSVLSSGSTMSAADGLRGLVTDETAARMITEVGIPDQVGGHVLLSDFSDGPVTVKEDIGPLKESDQIVENFVSLGTTGTDGEGLLLLDGRTGEVLVWEQERLSRVTPRLDVFVYFLTLIQEQINTAEDEMWDTDGEEVREAFEAIWAGFQSIDEPTVRESGEYWRRMMEDSFHSMGFHDG
ncbi:SUKH-4 family immunity protein [Streptomyces jumonjinensis]|nr:SUKH-4 family immunity protein [Streptomyces jumonjinensis]